MSNGQEFSDPDLNCLCKHRNANNFSSEIFNSQTFVTKWLKHRFEHPVIQDRAPEGQIPGLFDCCHCFHELLIVSMIASFIC